MKKSFQIKQLLRRIVIFAEARRARPGSALSVEERQVWPWQ
jgi:hypothetical protein